MPIFLTRPSGAMDSAVDFESEDLQLQAAYIFGVGPISSVPVRFQKLSTVAAMVGDHIGSPGVAFDF